MARNTNDLSGRVNIPTKVATYTGLDTETAEVVIDNVDKTIAVNVDLSDISSQFISQAELDREVSSREAADDSLRNSIDVLETLLENETLTRRSADEYVQKELQKEINRATTKEASLSSTDAAIRGELQDETGRAEAAEAGLQRAIGTEEDERKAADIILQGNIDTVSGAVENLDGQLATVAKSGEYRDLEHKPDLSDMATKTWVGEQGFLTSSDISNMVTTDTDQEITGEKRFFGYFSAESNDGDYYISVASDAVYLGDYVEVDGTLWVRDSLESPVLETQSIKASNQYTYGLSVPNSSSWTANKTIATTDQIPDDSNLVHKTGDESIAGNKTFIGDVYTDKITIDGKALFNANVLLDGVTINENQDGYGLRLPDTSEYTDNHTIATIDDIPDDSNLVHKTGEEFIAGAKHFTNGIWFSQRGLAKLDQSSTNNNELVWSTATTSAKFTIRGVASNGLTISEDGKIIGTKATVETGINTYLQLPSAGTSSTYATLATTDDIPDESTLVHTTGDEDIDGTKTFTGEVVVNDSGSGLVWVGGSGGASLTDNNLEFGSGFSGIITNRSIFTNPVTNGGSGLKINQDNITKRTSTLGQGRFVVNDYTFNLPNKSGTIALTSDLPTISNYVDLTSNQTISGYKTFSGGGDSTAIILSNGAFILSPTYKVGPFNSVDDDSVNHSIKFHLGQYDGSSTNEEIYLPRKSGTIALTSDIPSLTNYVTTNTPQNITALKTFSQNTVVEYSNKNISIKNNGFTHTNTASFATQNLVFADPSTSHTLTIPAVDGTLAVDGDVVHKTGDETILGNKTFGNNSSGTTTTFYGNIASADTIDSTGLHLGTDYGKRPVDAKSILTYDNSLYLNQGKALYAGDGITYYYRNYVDGQAVETDYKLDFPNKKSGVLALTSDCTKLYKHQFDIVLTNTDLATIPSGSQVRINVNALSTSGTEWETLSELDGGGYILSAFGNIPNDFSYIFELKLLYSSLGNGTLLLNVHNLTDGSVKCVAVTTVSGGSPNAFELEDSVSPL